MYWIEDKLCFLGKGKEIINIIYVYVSDNV